MEDEVLHMIRKFYPANIYPGSDEYLNTTEFGNLKAAINKAEDNLEKWDTFKDTLTTEL